LSWESAGCSVAGRKERYDGRSAEQGSGGGLLCIFEREGHDQIGLERVG
jgi:hypothetical protein